MELFTRKKPSTVQTEKIFPIDLIAALDHFGPKIKVLSLDCFDTILWRKTANPADVFLILQNHPAFKPLGYAQSVRGYGEYRARHLKYFQKMSSEVNLQEVYSECYSGLDQATIDELCEHELNAEMEMCYAFLPIVELIRAAHAKGLKIVIVSDTYFKEEQLRRLLSHALPEDVMAMFSQIFCSCEHGKSKPDGLLGKVLQALQVPAESVLHIGDNPQADYVSARAFNINALHLIQQRECIDDVLRMQATAAKILDPSIGATTALYSPFRGVFSATKMPVDNPETIIGYASLGPIMYSFAKFICSEVEELRRAGKRPKVVFLMRDGYLPSLACEELMGESIGKRVRISRFASYAASFQTRENIVNYLLDIGSTDRYEDICRQFLLPEKVSAPIIKLARAAKNPTVDFLQLILRTETLRIILQKSAEYRERLKLHIKKELGGLDKGDTLVLVDLGYAGTAQRRLTSVFAEDGIEVVGRYLIALRAIDHQLTRKGLMDSTNYCDNAMQTLVFYISILEQLSTSNERSVIDYDKDGNGIYSDIQMSDQQRDKLHRIQAETLRFVREAKEYFKTANMSLSEEILRQNAIAELTRMIFFQSNLELDHLQTFEVEMNLGTTDIIKMFDPEQGLLGLRRRGMFYLERPSKTTRTNYPAELRKAGIEFSLSLLAQHRFGIDLKLRDMVLRHEKLNILFRRGQETHVAEVEAISTHEGYYAVWIPATTTDIQVSILFGKKYQWIQFDGAELIKMEAFINQAESQNTADAWSCLIFDKMKDHGQKLFECLSESSSLIMSVPTFKLNPGQYILRVVFRPTVNRVVEQANKNQNVSYSVTI